MNDVVTSAADASRAVARRRTSTALAVVGGLAPLLFASALFAQGGDGLPVEAAKGLSGILATGGGYGLSAILFGVIFWREKKMDTMIERVIGLVSRQHEVLAEHNLNVKRHNDLLEGLREDVRERK